MLYCASWFTYAYRISSLLDLRTMKGEDRWQPVYINRWKRNFLGRRRCTSTEENAHVPRTKGQSRAEGAPRHFWKPLLRQWEKEGLARLRGWGKTIEVARCLDVQITDVSQTKWMLKRVVSFRFEERISFTFFIIGLIFCLKQCWKI